MTRSVPAVILLLLAAAARGGDEPKAGADKDPQVKEPALREELLEMVKEEQKVRVEVLKEWADKGISPLTNKVVKDPALVKLVKEGARKMAAVDEKNLARLAEVVKKYGWPGKSLVDQDGAHAAWLMLQHADNDRPFQKKCLKLMKEAPKGEVEPADIAFLTDRLLIADKKKQLYGTQLIGENGVFKPQPIEDEENVDKRRAELGLVPMKEYLKLAAAEYEKAVGKPPEQKK
jgi:hypothetical protein